MTHCTGKRSRRPATLKCWRQRCLLAPCLVALLLLDLARSWRDIAKPFWADDPSFLDVAPLSWRMVVGTFTPSTCGPDGKAWFYRPLFVLYTSLLKTVFPAQSPVTYHLCGWFLHAIAVALFALLVLRVLRDPWLSLAAVAVVTFCPLTHGAVAWFAANSTVLAAVFYMLTLHCWLSLVHRVAEGHSSLRTIGLAALAATLSVCSVLSKEDAYSLVLVMGVFLLLAPRRARGKRNGQLLALLCVLACLHAGLLYVDYQAHELAFQQGFPLHFPVSSGSQPLMQNLADRLDRFVRFCSRATLGVFAHGDSLATALGFALVGLHARVIPYGLLAWAWCACACLPAPLMAGAYGIEASRFYYIPWFPISVFGVLCLREMWCGIRRREIEVELGSALIASVIVGQTRLRTITLWRGDPLLEAAAMVVVLCLVCLLTRRGIVHPRVPALLFSVATMRLAGRLYLALLTIPPFFVFLLQLAGMSALYHTVRRRFFPARDDSNTISVLLTFCLLWWTHDATPLVFVGLCALMVCSLRLAPNRGEETAPRCLAQQMPEP